MVELVNLEECVDFVVKVVRRNDQTLYGKIRYDPHYPDDDRPFIFDLGSGGGLRYSKYGRVVKKANNSDIIWIKKIAKEEPQLEVKELSHRTPPKYNVEFMDDKTVILNIELNLVIDNPNA